MDYGITIRLPVPFAEAAARARPRSSTVADEAAARLRVALDSLQDTAQAR